jgi:hypothetical protein
MPAQNPFGTGSEPLFGPCGETTAAGACRSPDSAAGRRAPEPQSTTRVLARCRMGQKPQVLTTAWRKGPLKGARARTTAPQEASTRPNQQATSPQSASGWRQCEYRDPGIMRPVPRKAWLYLYFCRVSSPPATEDGSASPPAARVETRAEAESATTAKPKGTRSRTATTPRNKHPATPTRSRPRTSTQRPGRS